MDMSNSRPREAPVDGDEFDVTSRWRRMYARNCRAGVNAWVKRKLRRRERRRLNRELD